MRTATCSIQALVGAALGAVLLACSRTSSPGLPADGPYVRGPVESIRSHATGTGLLVRAGPGSREPCGIQATTDARTRYLRRTGPGELRRAAPSDVEVGDTVEVHVAGPVAESCPVQGRAAVVVLVSGPAR